MADRQPCSAAQESLAVSMRIYVADVGDVVTFLLHPVSERKLPEQKLARALRERCIDDLAVLAVWPIPAHFHPGAAVPFLVAVVVQRPLAGPAIVRSPGT